MFKLPFVLTLLFLYILHDLAVTRWYRKKFNKNDYFFGKNTSDEMQRFLGNSVYLVFSYYLVVIIYLITGFDFWGLISNIRAIDSRFFEIAGFVSGLLCIVMMVISRINLGSSWRVGIDKNTKDTLVTNGLYRFIRNPYFTFLLSLQFSIILIVPNAVTMFSFIQSLLLLNLQVRREEIFLGGIYGEQYIEYKNKTWRFIPKL